MEYRTDIYLVDGLEEKWRNWYDKGNRKNKKYTGEI